MSLLLDVIFEKKAIEQLKNAPKELQEYVKALERANVRWKEINNEAIKKIKELSKTH